MLSEQISSKFKKTKYTTVKDWKNESKCPLSLELLTSVINRGREPSIPAAITMLYLLGTPPAEIASICKAAGDDVFWRIISPQVLTSAEKELIDKLQKLDEGKRKLIMNMIDQLGV